MNWQAYAKQVARKLFILGILGALVWFGVLPFIHWLMFHPHPILEALREHIIKNLGEYATFVGVLSIAFVCTWPVLIPQTAQDWWTWFRDAFQTAVPAARNGHNNEQKPNLKPPEDPAQPQENV